MTRIVGPRSRDEILAEQVPMRFPKKDRQIAKVRSRTTPELVENLFSSTDKMTSRKKFDQLCCTSGAWTFLQKRNRFAHPSLKAPKALVRTYELGRVHPPTRWSRTFAAAVAVRRRSTRVRAVAVVAARGARERSLGRKIDPARTSLDTTKALVQEYEMVVYRQARWSRKFAIVVAVRWRSNRLISP